MAQKIKIVKIEVKEGDNARGHWKNYIITGEDKAKVSVFEPPVSDPPVSSLKEGDTIEAEIELKGKYANLKAFKLLEHVAVPIKPETPMTEKKAWSGGRSDGDSPEKRASIEAQKAGELVVILEVAGKLPPEWRYLLNGTLLWCDKRLNPTGIIPDKPLKPPVATPQPLKQVTGSPTPKTAETPVSDEPKTVGELYTAYLSHFTPEERRKINAKTDISNFKPAIDLKDIQKAWREIQTRKGWR